MVAAAEDIPATARAEFDVSHFETPVYFTVRSIKYRAHDNHFRRHRPESESAIYSIAEFIFSSLPVYRRRSGFPEQCRLHRT